MKVIRFRSIRFKIIFYMVISSLISILLVGSISTYQSKGIIEKYAEDNLELLVKSYAYRVDSISGASSEKNINEQIANEIIYDTGYLSLLDNEFNMIVHPNFTGLGKVKVYGNDKELENSFNKIKEKQEDTFKYTYNGSKMITSYYTLNNGNILMGNVQEEEVFQNLNNNIKEGYIVIIIGLTIAIALAMIFGHNLYKPIKLLTKYLDLTSQFDLSIETDDIIKKSLNRKDEISDMISALANMRQQLRHVALDIKSNASLLKEYAENTTNTMNETTMGIESVASSSTELVKGASELARISEDGSKSLNQLGENIDTALSNSKEANVNIEKIINSSRMGLEAVATLNESIESTMESSNCVLDKASNLEEKSKEIDVTIQNISNIAKQTNLLALNASIEAARAGEHGRGFAIVAEEIRKLADNVSESAGEIKSRISEIHEEIIGTKKSVTESNALMNHTNLTIVDTENQFREINNVIIDIVLMLDALTNQIDTIHQKKNVVMLAIEEISGIAEESAASTKEASASLLQQFTHIEEINNSTDELNRLIKSLNHLTDKFKIN